MKKLAIVAALLICLLGKGVATTTFKFANKCSYTIWVATLSGANSPPLSQTGFQLQPSSSSSLPAPPAWSGRFWGRSFCSTDSSGKFSCLTGDCRTGQIPCNGAGGSPPTTLVEITLGSNDSNKDFYDVSLVDGYNLPVAVAPEGGSGDCKSAGCKWDLNGKCPPGLAVTGPGGSVIACKSACEAFGDPRDCCTGAYATPSTCGPTNYSMVFKSACPAAYSYAYDDRSSTFTCVGPQSYTLTFCP
ncbi:thaumatin-like protein 1b [Phalaenopsis equestris]|uniref:thaumatin-like protein 1b n=1 Tax=Phalaenopsis equestris TaxID=78828 RepID=UPI0009E3550B|nr:thaumatin-like protein 1b [Phalaenopsis equestris]